MLQSSTCLTLGLAGVVSFVCGSAVSGATRSIDASAFDPAATVINFETGSTALPTVSGVHFVEEHNSDYAIEGLGATNNGATFFGQWHYENLSAGPPTAAYTRLAIDFTSPVQAVGGWVQNVNHDSAATGMTVLVYNAGGGLLAQQTVDLPAPFPPQNGPFFVGFASDEGIGRIEWRPVPWGHIGVDNVTFGTVPEPGLSMSIILLLDITRRAGTRSTRRARRG